MTPGNDPNTKGDGARANVKPCPICEKPVAKDDAEFPFCSKRCRTIDLGKWADEKYMITRPIEQGDLDEE